MKTTETDILKDNGLLRQTPFSTPEGYFENVRQTIKDRQGKESGSSRNWARFSIAACIAILLAAGTLLLTNAHSDIDFTEEDYLVFSDDLSTEVIYDSSVLYAYSEDFSEEEIIEYLIESGWDADEIE